MNAVPQPVKARGLALLAAHLSLSDADAPTARERLEDKVGPELAHLLVSALQTAQTGRRAAA